MPGLNRMGPRGQGPMTGRGMGWCGGAYDALEVQGRAPRFGRGRGAQAGGWWNRPWWCAIDLLLSNYTGRRGANVPLQGGLAAGDELATLKGCVTRLEQMLGNLVTRIDELEKRQTNQSASPEKGEEG